MVRLILFVLAATGLACGGANACGNCGASSGRSSVEPLVLRVDEASERRPISENLFGVNGLELLESAPVGTFTAARLGGNRTSTYNWENDASNGAADHHHQNDDYFPSDGTPASAWIDFVRRARARGAKSLLTVPMLGSVAADRRGDGDVAQTPDYRSQRFRRSTPRCEAPLEPPQLDDDVVCQERGVAYLTSRVGEDVLGWSLDNEPGAWPAVHPRLRDTPTTYAELLQTSEAHALAVKAHSRAAVFGPVSFGWAEMVRLVSAPDADERDFLSTYLARAATWEREHGERLLDVLDVHWYPEARVGDVGVTSEDVSEAVADLRMQAPRSLYDRSYVEPSWITHDWLDDEAIALLPRLHETIASHYPGTRLAITEWHYGGGSDVSGAVAAADALGAFTRHRVDVAMLWPLTSSPSHLAVVGAFRMFRDEALRFGSTSLGVEVEEPEALSGWASLDDAGAQRVVVVVRRRGPVPIVVETTGTRFRRFDLDVSAGAPVARGELVGDGHRVAFDVAGPAVVTLVEVP